MNAVAISDSTSAVYPNIGRRVNAGRIAAMNPVAGRKMMYTSGCAKNQNRCCQSRASLPSAWLKKCVLRPVMRSAASIVLESITAGMAKTIMNEVTTIVHTNSGMRFRDMPGARCLNAVVMTSIAPISVLTSTSVTICDHTSTRLPGEKSGPASGT